MSYNRHIDKILCKIQRLKNPTSVKRILSHWNVQAGNDMFKRWGLKPASPKKNPQGRDQGNLIPCWAALVAQTSNMVLKCAKLEL